MMGALLLLAFAGWALMLGAVVAAFLTPGFFTDRRFRVLCYGALLIVAVQDVIRIPGMPYFWLVWSVASLAGVGLAAWGLVQDRPVLFRVGLAVGLGLVVMSIFKNLSDGLLRYIWQRIGRLEWQLPARLIGAYAIGLLFYSSLLALDMFRDAKHSVLSQPYTGGGPRRFCKTCGSPVDSDSVYCNQCGSVVP